MFYLHENGDFFNNYAYIYKKLILQINQTRFAHQIYTN